MVISWEFNWNLEFMFPVNSIGYHRIWKQKNYGYLLKCGDYNGYYSILSEKTPFLYRQLETFD